VLYGRAQELEDIDRRLHRLRDGHGGVLLIHGEAGIGKTSLLDEVAARSSTVLRCSGVESAAELEIPFAGLDQLLRGRLPLLDHLAAAQAAALRSALGLSNSTKTDRLLIGLGVFGVLTEISSDGPVVCLVDDAQWLDRPSIDALVFVAQRLDADAVLLVVAVRDPEPPPLGVQELGGSGTEIHLRGVNDDAADAILAEHVPDLPATARATARGAAHGNPLALLELSEALTAEHRAGRTHWPVPTIAHSGAGGRVLVTFRSRIAALPRATRTALLVAAADDTGEPTIVLAAAGNLGATIADLAPAEQAHLVKVTSTAITFRHPLIRTAVYSHAVVGERVAAHRALADTLASEQHADRRAWHLAAAAVGPDPPSPKNWRRPPRGHTAAAATR